MHTQKKTPEQHFLSLSLQLWEIYMQLNSPPTPSSVSSPVMDWVAQNWQVQHSYELSRI